jgi:hypothetical protein
MPKRILKKTHRRKHMKGGEHYAYSGALAPGVAHWKAGSELDGVAASQLPQKADLINKSVGGKRRRGTQKRVKRGGNKFGTAIASYTGTGSRGIADYAPLNVRGVAQEGQFNNYGAGPGNFSSFK